MRKRSKPPTPKRRSPVPPPGYVIDETSYNRRGDKRRLADAVADFRNEEARLPVKLVVFDPDGTLWRVEEGCHGLMAPPLRKVNRNTVADGAGNRLHLAAGVRKLFRWLRSRHILISIANRGEKRIALDILRVLKLLDSIVCPQVAMQRTAFLIRSVRDEIHDRYGVSLLPNEILRVSDSESDTTDAQSLGVRTALIGRDVRGVKDLPTYLSNLR